MRYRLKKMILLSCILAGGFTPFSFLFSANAPEYSNNSEPTKEWERWPLSEKGFVTTEHTLFLPGQTIPYQATAGILKLRNEQGAVVANLFFVSYTKSDEKDKASRPITFAFNGGPGSSSAWLHMGGIGPKKIPFAQVDQIQSAPYKWMDNPYTLLDLTDLVFIDPVGTGYSTAEKPGEEKQFYSLNEDIKAVAKFISGYLTQFDRWQSPKYLIGESYGTTRAAGLADYLQNNNSIFLNGVVLISVVLDFEQILWSNDNTLCQTIYLPSYAACAWYQKKSGIQASSLEDVIEQAKQFTTRDYLLALYQGDALPDASRKEVAQKLAAFTGLSSSFIEKKELRIDPAVFATHLFTSEPKCIGRMDGRFTGYYTSKEEAEFSQDPSINAIAGSIAACLSSYLQEDLQFKQTVIPYELININANMVWDYNTSPDSFEYPNVTPSLRSALFVNPHLQVFMASGLFDLATPFYGARYSIQHLLLPEPLRKNVIHRTYPGGHMMYLDETCAKNLKQDLQNFYKGSSTNTTGVRSDAKEKASPIKK